MKSYASQHRPAPTPRRASLGWRAVAAAATLVVGASFVPASAQSMKPGGDGTTIQDPSSNQPKMLAGVGIDQKLGAKVPGDLTFKDDAGKTVKLADYYAKGRPVLLTLVYFGCPRTCTAALTEMTKTMKPMALNPGSDFEIVVVSFDPKEGTELAGKKKDEYVRFYGRPGQNGDGTRDGWHFLTGDQENIKKLTESVGFRYAWDEAHQQFIHAAGLMVLTPDGTLSKYFYGVEYVPRDLKLSLMDASENRIGSASDVVLRYCFEYDPHSGKYSIAILRIVNVFCVLTVLGLGAFVVRNVRRERAAARTVVADDGPQTGSPPEGDTGAAKDVAATDAAAKKDE